MADRAKYIKLGVSSDITDLSVIRDVYDKYDDGPARKYDGGTEPTQYINRGVTVRDRRTGEDVTFNSRQEADEYISSNYSDPNFYQGELPELTVTAKRPRSLLEQGAANFEETFGVTPRDAASFIPYVGDVLDVNDIRNNLKSGEYTEAGLGALMLLLPNVVEKPAKLAYRELKSLTRNAKKLKFYKRPKSDIERVLNDEASTFYYENIRPKLAAYNNVSESALPSLFHTTKSGGFNNLPIEAPDKAPSIFSTTAGFHELSGKNVVYRGPKMRSSAVHEAASHGTDELIPGSLRKFYKGTISELKDRNKLIRLLDGHSDSNKWYEFRSTKNEVERLLKKRGIDVDNISDRELIKLMRDRNAYGADYYWRTKGLLSDDLLDSWGDPSTYGIITNPDRLGTFNTKYRRSNNPFMDKLRYSIKYLPVTAAIAADYSAQE